MNGTVIQVATTGVDWPATAAVITCGLVGLAGIGSTVDAPYASQAVREESFRGTRDPVGFTRP